MVKVDLEKKEIQYLIVVMQKITCNLRDAQALLKLKEKLEKAGKK